ncbi:hydrogenase maturation protease [Candidatus Thorarchaeota archaeon]|nr:MAG: hydrogenase maturation protease [Candidatus Thorarchaeota archaeon]
MVYGWGNPIFGDDAVGIEVAKRIKREELPPGITVCWSSASPFSVAHRLLDCKKAILIDAWFDGEKNTERIIDWDTDLDATDVTVLTPHTASIVDVLKIYRKVYEDRFPSSVHVYGLCIKDIRLEEGVHGDYEEQIARVVALVLDEIRRNHGE